MTQSPPKPLAGDGVDSDAAADAAPVSTEGLDRTGWRRLRLQNFKGEELDFLAPYLLHHMRFRGRIFYPRTGKWPDSDGIHHYYELTEIYDLENKDIITARPAQTEPAGAHHLRPAR